MRGPTEVSFKVFVGIDWGSEEHVVTAIERDGQGVGFKKIPPKIFNEDVASINLRCTLPDLFPS